MYQESEYIEERNTRNTMQILDMNKLALDLVAKDFSDGHAASNGGPTRTSRALAIIHLAARDAYAQVTSVYPANLRSSWYAGGVSKLVAVFTALAVVACSSPPASRPAPPTPTPTSSAPLASPPATEPPAVVPAAPPPAQRFSDGDLGYRFDDPDRKGKLVAAANQVDLAVADEMTRQHLPGLALGIVIDGELVYSKGYGFADLDAKTPPDSTPRIGSAR